MKPVRIYHIAISWQHRGQRYEQEMVITAPDKKEAEEKAKNRIPLQLLRSENAEDSIHIATHDLGAPENHRTYYSSKLQISAKNKETLSLEYQMALTFAILWGHETGYRAGNPYLSLAEQEQLKLLAEQPDKENNIYQMAVRYLSDNTKKPNDFFRQELSKLFGEVITTVQQMTPAVDITEIESAEERAKTMIQQAKEKSQQIICETQEQTTEQLRLIDQIIDKLQKHPIYENTQETIQDSISRSMPTMITPDIPDYSDVIPEELLFDPNNELGFEEPETNSITKQEQQQEKPQDETDMINTTDPDQKPDEPENTSDDQANTPENNPDTPVKSNDQEQQKTQEQSQEPEPIKKYPVHKKPNLQFDLTDPENKTPQEERLIISENDIDVEILFNILERHTVTQGSNTHRGMAAYESWKIAYPDKTEKDILFEILSMTDTYNGLTGWEELCMLCKRQYPNCILDFKIPKQNIPA